MAGRACTVCVHPERTAIDQALAAGEGANRRIAAQHGLAESSVRRHKGDHLPGALSKAQDAQEVAQADNLLAQVQALQQRVLAILAQAEAAGDLRAALMAIREARGNLELLAKLLGELDDRALLQVNVTVEREYTLVQQIIGNPRLRDLAEQLAAGLEADHGHRD